MSLGEPRRVKILMVCLGNICRSPTAHGIMEKYIQDRELSHLVEVDSAGTGDWHIGESPDPRAVEAAARRGYQIAGLVARQVNRRDFTEFDYILAMDRSNLARLRELSPGAQRCKLQLLLEYGDLTHDTVPDPYYSGAEGFELVLDLLEDACDRFLEHLCRDYFPEQPEAPLD